MYNSDLFWNHTWQSAQWRALCTEITEVNLSAVVYRLLHSYSILNQGVRAGTHVSKHRLQQNLSSNNFIFCCSSTTQTEVVAPQVQLCRVWTHGLRIMNCTFHTPETPSLNHSAIRNPWANASMYPASFITSAKEVMFLPASFLLSVCQQH